MGKFKHDFHKHKFKPGDICIYKSNNKYEEDLNGKLCKIIGRTKKLGPSFFQAASDYFRHDYCPEIKFAKSKTNTYLIEFIDVYDGMISGTPGDLDSWNRTDRIKIMKGVPEYDLEFNPIATKNYKEEQEKVGKLHKLNDPYDEEEWNDEDKNKHFKWDNDKKEWILNKK